MFYMHNPYWTPLGDLHPQMLSQQKFIKFSTVYTHFRSKVSFHKM